MNIFQRFLRRVGLSRYKIIHDQELGYCAAHRDDLGWWAIDGFGESSQSTGSIATPIWRHLWVDDIAEAGERINRHATNRGRTIVWEA
jgi:hypothetical protein